MKITIAKPLEVEIKFVRVVANFRYVGDDDDDDVPSDFPLLKGDTWEATIDLETGRILDWPEGEERKLFTKVYDEGSYYLLDADQNIVMARENNYVPHCVIPGEYGDYIKMTIGGGGIIANWNPDLEGRDAEEMSEIFDTQTGYFA